MTDTPWMTLDEASSYARRSRETLRRAAVECQRKGDRGLKGHQPKPHACWRFQRDDVDRWIRGEAPRGTNRRLHAA